MNRPVSSIVGILLAIICLGYNTGAFKIQCDNNLLVNATRDYIHIDIYHLIVNIIGLYYISTLETRIGSAKYAMLIVVLTILSSLLTFIADKIFTINCSIGFSGILLGLMTYSLLSQGTKVNWQPILYLFAISITPSSPNMSVSGHLIGIVAGVIAFMFTSL